jgi:hypothetical protein
MHEACNDHHARNALPTQASPDGLGARLRDTQYCGNEGEGGKVVKDMVSGEEKRRGPALGRFC